MSDDPLLDGLREQLARRAVPVAPETLTRRIGGRTPRELDDAVRARALRAGAGVASVVLAALLAVGPAPGGGGPVRSASAPADATPADLAADPPPLAHLAAPPLAADEPDGRIDEVALLDLVVFGGGP